MSAIVHSQYQLDIFRWIKEAIDSVVIKAAAGSGKSYTTIEVAKILPSGASALFLAFNKHIVLELKKKLPSNIEARTCHSLGFGPVAKAFKGKMIVDGWEKESRTYRDKYGDLCSDVIESLFKDRKWEEKKSLKSQLKALVGFTRNTLVDYESELALMEMADRYNVEVKEPVLFHHVKGIIETGIALYKQRGEIDYTDMIWLVVKLNLPLTKFDYILIDEAQDLNALQHEMIFRSCHKKTRVIAVGDEMQSMYAFTGAMSDSMQLLKEKFNARELPLSICYRCPQSHIQLARVIDNDRTEWAPGAPYGEIGFILQEHIYKFVKSGDLVLCRLTAPLLKICIKLISMSVSAKVLGRNIGAQILSVVEDAMAPSPDGVLCDWKDFPEHLNALERGMIEKLSKQKGGDFLVEMFQDKVEAIRGCYTSPGFNITSKVSFTKQIENLFSDDNSPITLCTIHRAKGLEADNIFLVMDNNGNDCMPLHWKNQQNWELEQEYHIIYVALTRAKKSLRFCSSDSKLSDKHKHQYMTGAINPSYKKKVSVTETPQNLEKEDPQSDPQPFPENKIESITVLKPKEEPPPLAPVVNAVDLFLNDLTPKKKKKKKEKKQPKTYLEI
jgi:DNA helicase-2/ATP-dependent DNA helicase PcrA